MNRKDRDRIIEVSALVKRLREQLAGAEEELDRLLTAAPPVQGESSGDQAASLSDQVMDLIQHIDIISAHTVAEALNVPTAKMQSVRTILARLAKRNPPVIVRKEGEKGRYRLASDSSLASEDAPASESSPRAANG